MIYITGDTHGEYGRFSNKRMKNQGIELGENDYVIVCGDFGLCWAKDRTFDYNCRNFAEKKYTILWIQGNHENYDMIEEYPIEEWHGGKVRHIVRDKVILLERGQVFEIEEKSFFTFGGASSHDVQGGILDRDDVDYEKERCKAVRSGLPFRIRHESWWKQELPSEEEMEEGRNNLAKYNYKVDYILTHCCSTTMQNMIEKGPGHFLKADILTDYLQEIEEKTQYKHWFFGHYHEDRCVDDKHTILYYAIMEIDGNSEEKLLDLPILGKPKYQCGDVVEWRWGSNDKKIGKIEIVDAYGTFEQNLEPSYDILEENGLYKHICESKILHKVKVRK